MSEVVPDHKHVAIIGGGWAGMAAAVIATQAGHHATVFEASQALGGRARVVNGTLPDGTPVTLDNGQHILIGAYSQALHLMQQVGVNLATALLRLPLTLKFPDGKGLKLPDWPSSVMPLDAAWGIATARGWTWRDKFSLLRAASDWQRAGFTCAPRLSVAQLCQKSSHAPYAISPRVMAELIEPLCVSALNTSAHDASAQVFLRVLQDAMFSKSIPLGNKVGKNTAFGSSNLLLPMRDLSNLFPHAAAAWLIKHGGQVRLGDRVESLEFGANVRRGWQVSSATGQQAFGAVILAGSPSNMAKVGVNIAHTATNIVAEELNHLIHREAASWLDRVNALRYEAITTVYAYAKDVRLTQPMVTLRSDARQPAQFVFDRGQLGGPAGLLAFVVSASQGERDVLQSQVLAQGAAQLNLPELQAVQTIVEKRATFACTPGLVRPNALIAPGLLVCGDYVAGPYPATLEGAVRSAQQAVKLL
ncbi:MAG: hydroxysqualene dehydroxylase HpnE [Burkholderiaceae bacterium]|nr:hydroxysqualene dehydroxylase HpnE [Burkholderiaceae bacterium]